MKIHVSAAVLILTLSLFYELSNMEFLIVCLTVAAVLVCELFNTAIEALVDIAVDVYHPKAKIAKDAAAGAVLVSAVASLAVGYFIFFNRVSASLGSGIRIIKHSPMNITVIALLLSVILVLALKAYFGKGTPLSGGMPSGHAAISLSITTAISLWTENMGVTLLCLFLSFLVIQSRLEAKIHNILESVVGAAVGIFATLLLFQMFYK